MGSECNLIAAFRILKKLKCPGHTILVAENRPAKRKVMLGDTNSNIITAATTLKANTKCLGCYQKKGSYEGSHHFRGMKGSPANCQNNYILWHGAIVAKTLDYCSLGSTFPPPEIYHEETKQGWESSEPPKVLLRAQQFPLHLTPVHVACSFQIDGGLA